MKKAKKSKNKKKAQSTKKSKHTSKSRGTKKLGTSVPTTVCSNGTIDQDDGEITFVNGGSAACTITSCEVPGWPSPPDPNPVVPAAQNGILGEVVVPLTTTPTPVGTYDYTSACCPGALPPTIKVQ